MQMTTWPYLLCSPVLKQQAAVSPLPVPYILLEASDSRISLVYHTKCQGFPSNFDIKHSLISAYLFPYLYLQS